MFDFSSGYVFKVIYFCEMRFIIILLLLLLEYFIYLFFNYNHLLFRLSMFPSQVMRRGFQTVVCKLLDVQALFQKYFQKVKESKVVEKAMLHLHT